MLNSPTLEKKTVLTVGLIYAIRMLGLFIVLPTFSLYASSLKEATPFLLGVAFGIYGLTQASLQIPFGYLSDRYGRNIIIYFGLALFAIGSVICALTDSIYWMIIGRMIQGGGAIGSALLALLADHTPEQARSKAMAIIGLFIGSSVFLGLFLGSILATPLGMSGLFWLTASTALFAILLLHRCIPEKLAKLPTADTIKPTIQYSFLQLFFHPELIRFNLGTFFQHALFTVWLYAIPLILQQFNTAQSQPFAHNTLWLFYLITLVVSFISMVPLLLLVQKKQWFKQGFIAAITTMLVVFIALSLYLPSVHYLAVYFYLYLIAFNLLEAWLPSMTAKVAPAQQRGAAMGIYSTSQFLGIFFGGLMCGWIHQSFSLSSLFYSCVIMTFMWLSITITLRIRPTTQLVYSKTEHGT